MAHPCCICDGECYCHGDIDDVITCKTPKNCDTCGCGDEDWREEDDYDEPEYYQCLGCGWTGDQAPGDCPRCTGATISGVY